MRVNLPANTAVRAIMPYSEVCVHLRVAGTAMLAKLIDGTMVQLFNENGSPFSFPITAGEAGFLTRDGQVTYEAPDA